MTEPAAGEEIVEPRTRRSRAGLSRWWLDRPVLVKGMIVVAIPMLALVVVVSAGLVLQAQERNGRQVAIAANGLTAASRVVLADAIDAETGLRGYAGTGETKFLAPYTAAAARMDTDVNTMLAAAKVERLTGRADLVATTVRQQFGQLATLRDLVRGGAPTVELVPALATAKAVMDRLRIQVAALTAVPTRLAAEKRASINRLEKVIQTVQVAGLALGLLAGLAGVALFTTGISRRIRIAAENAGRLGRAEPLEPAVRSADEIGRLSVSLVDAQELLNSRLAEVSAARDEALQATRAKNTFLSRTSHELRTPLHAILGFAQLLDLADLDADDRDSAAHIISAGRHLLTLINELIDTALIEAGELRLSVEPVSVHDISDDIANLIAPLAAARDITVRRDFTDPNLAAYADDQRLRQILLNLASNAIKYNHDGGTVTVAYGTDGPGMIELSVTDTGPGLVPEEVERVFVPFERLNAEQHGIEGTGIGLPLALALTEALHGTLDVASTPGEGATFTVRLPRAPDIGSAEIAGTDVQQGTAGDDSGLLAEQQRDPRLIVLSIEDNVANSQMLIRIFHGWPDTTLHSASCAMDGIALALRVRPDVVLLDLHLPDLPGEEVFARLRAEAATANTPIIVLSADATAATTRRLLARGAAAYLTKPLDIDLLRRTIDEAVATRANELAAPGRLVT